MNKTMKSKKCSGRTRLLLILCALVLVFSSGCGNVPAGKPANSGSAENPANTVPAEQGSSEDLMVGITAAKVSGVGDLSLKAPTVTDFGAGLFRKCFKSGENVLISPLSVLSALAMTANGAKGQTLSQMEKVLGMPAAELNEYMYSYINSLPSAEQYKLKLANSIWFTADERFTVEQDFLQTNADYYGASIYKDPFDASALERINSWVEDNTDGLIKDILDKIPDSIIMYLINALAFDARWAAEYNEYQIGPGDFTLEDGTKKTVEYMSSEEKTYISLNGAEGFIKQYQDGKYAFAALLPAKGQKLEDLVNSLDGATIYQMLANASADSVGVSMPKFEAEYSIEMSQILKSLGMTDAFDGFKADLSGLGTSIAGNISISKVIHKTFISVDEKGTKAAASTVVEAVDNALSHGKEVRLTRPFLYMLIDCQTNIPFFIGTFAGPES